MHKPRWVSGAVRWGAVLVAAAMHRTTVQQSFQTSNDHLAAKSADAFGTYLAAAYPWEFFCTFTIKGKARWIKSAEDIIHQVHQTFRDWFMLTAERTGGAKRIEVPAKEWTTGGRTGKLLSDGDLKFRSRGGYRQWEGPLVNAYKSGRGHWIYAGGVEPHADGALHAHAVLRVPRYFDWIYYGDGYKAWRWGGTSFSRPECQEDVTRYITRYVAKDGDMFISDSFEADDVLCDSVDVADHVRQPVRSQDCQARPRRVHHTQLPLVVEPAAAMAVAGPG